MSSILWRIDKVAFKEMIFELYHSQRKPLRDSILGRNNNEQQKAREKNKLGIFHEYQNGIQRETHKNKVRLFRAV